MSKLSLFIFLIFGVQTAAFAAGFFDIGLNYNLISHYGFNPKPILSPLSAFPGDRLAITLSNNVRTNEEKSYLIGQIFFEPVEASNESLKKIVSIRAHAARSG